MVNKTIVRFKGGPWHNQTASVDHVTAPVYAVADEIGKEYWLDINSDPPLYHWLGHNGQ